MSIAMPLAIPGLPDTENNETLTLLYGGISKPVEVVDGQVVFHIGAMKLNQYYVAQVDDTAYLYRRVSDGEVEVYGLAEADS